MQQLRSHLLKRPIFSIQSGMNNGIVNDFILNTDTLRIVLWVITEVSPPPSSRFLLPDDIRQIIPNRVIIDHEEKLSSETDLVKYRDLIQQNFRLINVMAMTESGRRLGHVDDFTFRFEDNLVSKLHIRANIWHRLLQEAFIIDRSDVIDVKPDRVVVRDGFVRSKSIIPAALPVETS